MSRVRPFFYTPSLLVVGQKYPLNDKRLDLILDDQLGEEAPLLLYLANESPWWTGDFHLLQTTETTAALTTSNK